LFDGKRIICITASYNELHKINKVVERVKAIPFIDEMLVMDDGSTDGSPDTAEALGATVISIKKVMGVGYVIRNAIEYAQQKKYDIIVFIAGNNKDDPQQIVRLLTPITKEGCDFVQGSRFKKGGYYGKMPLYRIISTRFIHPLIFSLITGKRVSESTNGFRAMKASMLKDPRINLNQSWLNEYELEPYLYYNAIRLGYKTSEVPVSKIYPPKILGYTKMKPVTGWWSILRPLFLLGLGLKK